MSVWAPTTESINNVATGAFAATERINSIAKPIETNFAYKKVQDAVNHAIIVSFMIHASESHNNASSNSAVVLLSPIATR